MNILDRYIGHCNVSDSFGLDNFIAIGGKYERSDSKEAYAVAVKFLAANCAVTFRTTI